MAPRTQATLDDVCDGPAVGRRRERVLPERRGRALGSDQQFGLGDIHGRQHRRPRRVAQSNGGVAAPMRAQAMDGGAPDSPPIGFAVQNGFKLDEPRSSSPAMLAAFQRSAQFA